jgi:formylglycine-generating enzyme required for sulfatase activity
MAGNAWELTRSPLIDYPFVMPSAEALLRADSLWVMRGGSFQDTINNVRSAVRGAVDPSVRNPTIGFRLVISSL